MFQLRGLGADPWASSDAQEPALDFVSAARKCAAAGYEAGSDDYNACVTFYTAPHSGDYSGGLLTAAGDAVKSIGSSITSLFSSADSAAVEAGGNSNTVSAAQNVAMQRAAVAQYCGGRFGTTGKDFQPCIAFYCGLNPSQCVRSQAGDYIGSVSPGTTVTPLNPALLPPVAAPWYKTPIGVIAILAGAFAGYKLLKR